MRQILTVALLLVLAGCLPIDLSVSKDGRVLIPRAEGFFTYNPTTGDLVKVAGVDDDAQPVFGLFLPDGKDMILVTTHAGGGMGGDFTYKLRTPDGKPRELYTASNTTYATVSPDGKYLAVARLSDQQAPGFDENLPELFLINITDGSAKQIVTNIISLHGWMPDSKSLLVIHLTAKSKNGDMYAGNVQLINVADGSIKQLAKVIGPKGAFLDLSSDGKQALFTATKAVTASSKEELKLPVEKDENDNNAHEDNGNGEEAPHLYSLDIPADKLTTQRDKVKYVRFSPDGKHVLLADDEENNLLKLEVADTAFKDSRIVATDAAGSVGGGFGPGTDIHPTWLDNNTVLYLAERAVYGSAGKNFMLTTVSIDGKTRKIHQAAIDAGVLK